MAIKKIKDIKKIIKKTIDDKMKKPLSKHMDKIEDIKLIKKMMKKGKK